VLQDTGRFSVGLKRLAKLEGAAAAPTINRFLLTVQQTLSMQLLSAAGLDISMKQGAWLQARK